MARKGENIYKRKDKRWEARYIKGYRPDGRAQYGYCYAKSYAEVKKKMLEARNGVIHNRAAVSTGKTRQFAYYCDEWLVMNRTHIKESTYAKYRFSVENHVKPQLGGYFLQALSSALIEEFSYKLLFDKGLSPKTVKDILTMLNSILKYTTRQCPEEMPRIEIIYPKDMKKEMRVLTREEQVRFISYLTTDIDQCKFSVLLALFTGMRIGEVCALRWENVFLEDKIIKVSATMQRLHDFSESGNARTKIIISSPKSETSVRMIPMTDAVVSLFRAQGPKSGDAFVLTGVSDHYIEPRTLQYWLSKYTKACGLEGVHFHTLRHTFATRCVEVDFELKSLSEILGHSSPRITLERYVHPSMELKRDNMKKLAALGF